MSALNAARSHRAISAVCRQSRRIHNSTTNQAAVLSPSTLNEQQELEEISLQPIFDIFDAPTRLSESSQFIREKYKSTTKAAETMPLSSRPSHVFTPPQPLSRPSPLPLPIIFDGPARPKNEVLALQRRLRDAGLSPQPRRHRAPASSSPFSSSEPLVQLFDGPARITRYHHQSQSDRENSDSSKLIISFGVAGVVGCAVLTKRPKILHD